MNFFAFGKPAPLREPGQSEIKSLGPRHRRGRDAGEQLSGERKTATKMRGYTTREKLKITAGAISAIVIVGWLAVLALALLSAR
jgi:hypothetical protein